MDNMHFYEYVLSLLEEAGHVITSVPVYANHTSVEAQYIDSSKDVVLSRFDRELLSLINNVSLLADIRWAGVVDELDENVQIFSITVDFPERVRSQNVADIHHLLQKYWDCKHSIVFFKNRENYIISFADLDRSHILSDWRIFDPIYDDVSEYIEIGNMSLHTCEDYFLDFIFNIAREYYVHPISFEEAAYGLMPIDYISKNLSSGTEISKDKIKEMIQDTLAQFEHFYGDDYVEPFYTGMDELAKYHNISDEIDRISFDLELDEDASDDEFDHGEFEDDEDHVDYDDDYFNDFDEDIDPAIFDDPVLMVKWLEKRQKERESHSENRQLELFERQEETWIEAERREQERLEAERRERERQEAERREQERLEAERRERERREAERREQERLEAKRQEQERLEAERRERERQAAERREQERLAAERRERERQAAECREQERQTLLKQLEETHLVAVAGLNSRYRQETGVIQEKLSITEMSLDEIDLRVSKLSFLQFREKRNLSVEKEELIKRRDELLALLAKVKRDYEEQHIQEQKRFREVLHDSGFTFKDDTL